MSQTEDGAKNEWSTTQHALAYLNVAEMITPEMNFVLFMRFFYLWTIKSKASFKALAFHLSMDKYPLMVQSIAVLMKVEGAVSDISQTLEGILASLDKTLTLV